MIRPHIDFEHPAASSLAAVLESAVEFGLTPDEIWEAVVEAPDRLPADVRAPYIEEITGDLAKRLVEKQRAA
jgi:hypothetical protein